MDWRKFFSSLYCNRFINRFPFIDSKLKIIRDLWFSKFKLTIFIFALSLIFLFSSFLAALPQFKADNHKKLVSLDFKDTEIGNILRLLAEQQGLNIIASASVKGPVTVKFSNVTIEEALDAIITINGFTYTKKGRIIKVTSPQEAELEPNVTRHFFLNHADATDLRETLQKMLSKTGIIQSDTRSNSLIITDSPTVITEMENLVFGLDKPPSQVMIEAKIIETILDDAEKLGIDWTIRATASGAKVPATLPFPRELTDISHKGKTPEEFFPLGLTPAFPSSTEPVFPFALRTDFIFGALDFTQFQAVLEFLQSREDTTLISNPRLLTLNNQEAKIVVGTRIPIPTYERNPTTGLWEITGYEAEEVGIKLKVTPTINYEGYITLKIHPEVSTIIGYTGPQNERPIVSTRETETDVQIKDGQTVAIGGMIKEENKKKITRIPILGHLPILGFPFRKTELSKQKTDLLIFITAHVLKEPLPEKLISEEKVFELKPRRRRMKK